MQDAVTVVGYPIGGESISVTSGVVSRIEARTGSTFVFTYLLLTPFEALIMQLFKVFF